MDKLFELGKILTGHFINSEQIERYEKELIFDYPKAEHRNTICNDKIKRFFILFLSAIILLSFVSCNSFERSSDLTSSSVSQTQDYEHDISKSNISEEVNSSSTEENSTRARIAAIGENTSDLNDEERAEMFIKSADQNELLDIAKAAGFAWKTYYQKIINGEEPSPTGEFTSKDLMECFGWLNRESIEKYSTLVDNNGEYEKKYIVPLKDITDCLDKYLESYNFNPKESFRLSGDSYDEKTKELTLLEAGPIGDYMNQFTSVKCENHGGGKITLIAEGQWRESSETLLDVFHYGIDIKFSGKHMFFEKFYFIDNIQRP